MSHRLWSMCTHLKNVTNTPAVSRLRTVAELARDLVLDRPEARRVQRGHGLRHVVQQTVAPRGRDPAVHHRVRRQAQAGPGRHSLPVFQLRSMRCLSRSSSCCVSSAMSSFTTAQGGRDRRLLKVIPADARTRTCSPCCVVIALGGATGTAHPRAGSAGRARPSRSLAHIQATQVARTESTRPPSIASLTTRTTSSTQTATACCPFTYLK